MSLLDTIKRVVASIVMPVGVYDTTPPTYEDGDTRPFRLDGNGNLLVAIAAAVAASAPTNRVPGPHGYVDVTGTPAPLSANTDPTVSIFLKADQNNGSAIFWGPADIAAGAGDAIEAGEGRVLSASSLASVHLVSSSGTNRIYYSTIIEAP